MRVAVDRGVCHGHGRCYDLAPDVFEPDERGRVELAVTGELSDELEPDARIAVQNCPASALRMIPTGRRVNPPTADREA